jgi:hypothetical protein
VTDEASIANGKQTQSNNPWHHMKGIRQHLKVPGTILPKRLLRPYYLEYPHRIDDKQYVITSLSSLKDGLHFVYGSLYMIAGGGLFLDGLHKEISLICFTYQLLR